MSLVFLTSGILAAFEINTTKEGLLILQVITTDIVCGVLYVSSAVVLQLYEPICLMYDSLNCSDTRNCSQSDFCLCQQPVTCTADGRDDNSSILVVKPDDSVGDCTSYFWGFHVKASLPIMVTEVGLNKVLFGNLSYNMWS